MSNVIKFPKNEWDYIVQRNRSSLACYLAENYDEKLAEEAPIESEMTLSSGSNLTTKKIIQEAWERLNKL